MRHRVRDHRNGTALFADRNTIVRRGSTEPRSVIRMSAWGSGALWQRLSNPQLKSGIGGRAWAGPGGREVCARKSGFGCRHIGPPVLSAYPQGLLVRSGAPPVGSSRTGDPPPCAEEGAGIGFEVRVCAVAHPSTGVMTRFPPGFGCRLVSRAEPAPRRGLGLATGNDNAPSSEMHHRSSRAPGGTRNPWGCLATRRRPGRRGPWRRGGHAT